MSIYLQKIHAKKGENLVQNRREEVSDLISDNEDEED